ncbi:MAG: GMC family oxidoreductase N-terminal domain-containing protein, partial [Gemmatimonadota bacterium]
MKTVEADVLIVGTGFGAAAPALRLAEAGFRVRMIEKGPHIEPSKDFRQTQDPDYLRRYLKGYAGENISLLCGEGLGGGSGFYEMISLRAPSMAFDQRDGQGRRLWPAGVDRETLDPFYDTAEEMLNVRQLRPDQVPKTGLVFALMMKRLGYSCDLGRYAVRGCIGSGFCVTGCIYGAKQSLHLNYLPQAIRAGAVIETDTEALRIRPTGAAQNARSGALVRMPHRYEVLCRRRTGSGERIRYLARLVVLGGGTVGTATLLLRSKKTLPALSPHVGRNIAFNGSVKTAGLLADDLPDGDMFTGQSHPGVFSYEFLASHGVVVTAAKPLPLQAVASARLRLDGDTREPAYWGQPHVELMRRFRRRAIVLVAFGLTPPLASIRLRGD